MNRRASPLLFVHCCFKEVMEVLSLFDGMSCLQIALVELGIKPDKYYASEIDTHAIKQTQLNFPDTIQLGDVTKWQEWPINWSQINLIGAGSPCQGFSFSGKQLAFDDPRSKLFFVFVEILNHVKKFNPDVKFLLENVDMKKDHLRVISEYVGVFPVNINSNLVSAQNRNRWYWTNIRTKKVGLFDEVYTDIPQPKDEGVLLRDILEDEVDEKYFLSDKMVNYFDKRAANFNNGKVNIREYTDKATTLLASMSSCDISDNFVKANKKGLSPDQTKSSTLTCPGHGAGNHSDMDLICVAMRGRNPENPSDRRTGLPTEQRLEPNTRGKTNCLSTVQKDNLVMTKNYAQWDQSGKGYGSQQDRAFYEDGKHGTLSSSRSDNKTPVLLSESKIRRLTPTECARLQTVPSWYKWQCSDTQQYKMLGNGWTVKVIEHILSFMK
jgi:DNA (cytosine-5)-methyltransferase 3A